MERGGPSWAGWSFAPWGRAREWRLHAPDGASYCAEEIAELRRLWLDLDYWQVRCRELEARLTMQACYFTPPELALLQEAVELLAAAMHNTTRKAVARSRPGRRTRGGDVRSTNRKKGDAEVAGRVEIVPPGPSAAADFAGGRPRSPKTALRDPTAGTGGRIPMR